MQLNTSIILPVVLIMLVVQALRYLLFDHRYFFRPLWDKLKDVPLLGIFLNCPFCQGFWIGFIAYSIFFGMLYGLLWALVSGWASSSWYAWANRGKEEEDCEEDELRDDPPQPDDFGDQLSLLECNIDDMSGEFFGSLLDRLFEAGAADVWFTPVYGKKNRPLYQMSALSPAGKEEKCIRVILAHSSTAGIRRRIIHRIIMDRSFIEVKIKGEKVSVKKLVWKDIVKYSPEWEDCSKAANKLNITVAEIYSIAQVEARSLDNA